MDSPAANNQPLIGKGSQVSEHRMFLAPPLLHCVNFDGVIFDVEPGVFMEVKENKHGAVFQRIESLYLLAIAE